MGFTIINPYRFAAAPAGSWALDYVTGAVATAFSNTTRTFSSVSIGAEPTGGDKRYIVAVLSMLPTNSGQDVGTSTMTIGGSNATLGYSAASGGDFATRIRFDYLEVPTGTTADFVYNFTNAVQGLGLAVYAIHTDGTLNIYDTATDALTTSMSIALDSPSADAGYIAASLTRNATPGNMTIGGTAGISTHDYTADIATGELFHAAHGDTGGASTGETITFTDSTTSTLSPIVAGITVSRS